MFLKEMLAKEMRGQESSTLLGSRSMQTPRSVIFFLCLGLVAASQSGNLIRLGDAHPVALAAWRLLIAAVFLAPLAGRDLGLLKKLSPRERFLLVLAGLALATHFFAWIAAVQMTTVANAAVFFSINPVITATASYFIFGERASRRLFVSIALGILGVAVLGGGDLSLHREHLAGDAMAVLCSVLFTVYFLLGKRLRRNLETSQPKTGTTHSMAMKVAVYSQCRMSLLLAATAPRIGRSMK